MRLHSAMSGEGGERVVRVDALAIGDVVERAVVAVPPLWIGIVHHGGGGISMGMVVLVWFERVAEVWIVLVLSVFVV